MARQRTQIARDLQHLNFGRLGRDRNLSESWLTFLEGRYSEVTEPLGRLSKEEKLRLEQNSYGDLTVSTVLGGQPFTLRRFSARQDGKYWVVHHICDHYDQELTHVESMLELARKA